MTGSPVFEDSFVNTASEIQGITHQSDVELFLFAGKCGVDQQVLGRDDRHFAGSQGEQGIDIELDSTYRSIDGQIDVWEWFREEGYSDEYCFSHLIKISYLLID